MKFAFWEAYLFRWVSWKTERLVERVKQCLVLYVYFVERAETLQECVE
jgi:hypothetical protein